MKNENTTFMPNALEGFKYWDGKQNLFELLIEALRNEEYDHVDLLLRQNRFSIVDFSRQVRKTDLLENEELDELYQNFIRWELVQIEEIETAEEIRLYGG